MSPDSFVVLCCLTAQRILAIDWIGEDCSLLGSEEQQLSYKPMILCTSDCRISNAASGPKEQVAGREFVRGLPIAECLDELNQPFTVEQDIGVGDVVRLNRNAVSFQVVAT